VPRRGPCARPAATGEGANAVLFTEYYGPLGNDRTDYYGRSYSLIPNRGIGVASPTGARTAASRSGVGSLGSGAYDACVGMGRGYYDGEGCGGFAAHGLVEDHAYEKIRVGQAVVTASHACKQAVRLAPDCSLYRSLPSWTGVGWGPVVMMRGRRSSCEVLGWTWSFVGDIQFWAHGLEGGCWVAGRLTSRQQLALIMSLLCRSLP
jgi:hypothetical protein